MQTAVLTLRVPAELRDRLEALAKSTQRSKAYHGAEAIREYLEHQAWQIEEIQQGLKEADAGDFASDAEVEAVFNKWSGHAD